MVLAMKKVVRQPSGQIIFLLHLQVIVKLFGQEHSSPEAQYYRWHLGMGRGLSCWPLGALVSSVVCRVNGDFMRFPCIVYTMSD